MSKFVKILKRYGILIEDNDGHIDDLKRVPYFKDGETFKQWKVRTFGENIKGLKVYWPLEPEPQTKMITLSGKCGSDYLLSALQSYRGIGVDELQSALDENTEKVSELEDALESNTGNITKIVTKRVTKKVTEQLTKELTTMPKDLLREIIDEKEETLEHTALSFLERYINNSSQEVNTKEILSELISNYSYVVKTYRALEKSTVSLSEHS